jgi:hypothetical protein
MAEIVFRPPNAILYLSIGIVLAGIASVFLSKRETARRLVTLAVVVAVAGVLVIFTYRSSTLRVDEHGIALRGRTDVSIAWSEVTNAYHEPNLAFSPYRPAVRSRGVAIGTYRSGRFHLSNGDEAYVLAERTDQAVIFITDDLTYVFAPEQIQALVDAVNLYRSR